MVKQATGHVPTVEDRIAAARRIVHEHVQSPELVEFDNEVWCWGDHNMARTLWPCDPLLAAQGLLLAQC